MIVIGGMSSPDTIKSHDTIEIMDYDCLQWKEAFVHLLLPMYGIKPTICGNNIAIVGYDHTNGRSNEHYQIAAQKMIASLNPAVTYTVLDGDPTSAICFSIDFLLRDFYNKGLLDKDMVAFCSPQRKLVPLDCTY